MSILTDDDEKKLRILLDAAFPSRTVPMQLNAAPGYRTVLFGDSMTDFNYGVILPSSVTYDKASGVLTITESGGHFKWKGCYVNIWNRSYSSIYYLQRYQVRSIVSSTVYTVQLTAGLTDLPDYTTTGTALTGTTFAVTYQFKMSKSWLSWLNALTGQRFNVVYNGAQSGDTTVDARARLQRDCLDWKPQVVVMQSLGINDLTFDLFTSRNNVQRVLDNLRWIYDKILSSGAMLMLGLVTPVASGEARGQKSIMSAKDAINRFNLRYARNNAGVLIIDTVGSILNPTDATGLAKSGLLAAADNIHYTNVGGYRIAKDNQSNALAAFPSPVSTLPKSILDNATSTALSSPTGSVAGGVTTITATGAYVQAGQEIFIKGATGSYTGLNGRWIVASASASNIFTISTPNLPAGAVTGTLTIWTSRQLIGDNMLQTATGGTLNNSITGTGANLLTCENQAGSALANVVASVAAEANGYGNEQILTCTFSGTGLVLNDRPGVKFKNSVGTVDGKMFAGRTYELELQLRLASTNWAGTPMSEIICQLNFTANGTGEAWRIADLNQYEAVVPVMAENQTLHLKTPPITIPTDTASIDSCQMNVYVRAQAAHTAGVLTLGFSRFAVNDVTPDEPSAVSLP